MAPNIIRNIVLTGYVDRCEAQIPNAIGIAVSVSVIVENIGAEYEDRRVIESYIRDSYDLTPRGIIESPCLLDVNYNQVSSYGHLDKGECPWEE